MQWILSKRSSSAKVVYLLFRITEMLPQIISFKFFKTVKQLLEAILNI